MASSDSVVSRKSTNVRPALPLMVIRRTLKLLESVSQPLAVSMAEQLFTRPRRHQRPERESYWRGEATTEFSIPFGETELKLWQWGQGTKTVVLVHGWEGRGTQLGAFIEPLVASGFRVLAFDAPGHGSSGGSQTTLPEFAECIETIARFTGPLAGIIAHSMGAAATTIALSRGVQAERVVYVAPMFTVANAFLRFSKFVGLSEKSGASLREKIESRTGLPVDQIEGRVLAMQMSSPLLVIHDQFDKDIPIAEAQELARYWPQSTFVQVQGLGHRKILRDPQIVDSAVSFLNPDEPVVSRRSRYRAEIDHELFYRDNRGQLGGF